MKIDLPETANINAYKNNPYEQRVEKNQLKEEKQLEKQLEKSAVSVNISMNAQIVLFSMDVAETSKSNSIFQGLLSDENKDIFNFLSGEGTLDGLSLQDIGYEGKPITQLNAQEATDLLSEDGFFGINQTSQRVADFVFSFAGDDLELLEKGREGIIKGFEEAEKLFGGELPEISYKTQERTLSLIDEKINSLKTNKEEEVVE